MALHSASVIAEYSGLLVGLGFAVHALRDRAGHWPFARLFNVRAYSAFFAVNAHLFIRTMALMFTFAFVTAQGARLGGVILAANAVLMNLQMLTAFALDGFAHAAEALVGKAVGQRNRKALEQSVQLALKWSLKFAVGFCLFYIVAGPLLIRMLTDLSEVRESAMRFLPWLVSIAARVGLVVPLRRCLRWRDTGTGNAQHHGFLHRRYFPASLVPVAGLRQPWSLARFHAVHGEPRRRHAHWLSPESTARGGLIVKQVSFRP